MLLAFIVLWQNKKLRLCLWQRHFSGGLGLLDAISAFVVGLIEILFQNPSANEKGELTHCRLAKKYFQASRILKHCQNPSSKFRMLSLFLAQLFGKSAGDQAQDIYHIGKEAFAIKCTETRMNPNLFGSIALVSRRPIANNNGP
jgi:hypothetical protein